MHPAEYAELKDDSRPDIQARADDDTAPAPAAVRPAKPRAPPVDDDTLLTSAQTRTRMGGVSTMCLWRWMRDENVKFPAPMKINGRNYWRHGDLRRWVAERVNAA